MPRVATCTYAFREVGDFGGFAAHVVEVLDAASGAELVVLPELLTLELYTAVDGWRDATELSALAETTTFAGDYDALFSSQSRARGQHILAGSHLVRDGDQLLNVAHLYGPDGRLLHTHAKTHLYPAEFDLGTGEGDAMSVVEVPFARVGINICYEAEIPECSASVAEQGAQVLLCPSLTFTEAGFWRVRHCLAARAVENQIYAVHSTVAGPARGVFPGAWGRGSILAPCDTPWPANGVLAQTAPNADEVVIADLDVAALEQNRKSGAATTFADRRRRAERYRTWPSHLLDAAR